MHELGRRMQYTVSEGRLSVGSLVTGGREVVEGGGTINGDKVNSWRCRGPGPRQGSLLCSKTPRNRPMVACAKPDRAGVAMTTVRALVAPREDESIWRG
jgi:hypothetical protein